MPTREAHNLTHLREARLLTQEQLAAAAGLCAKTVWKAENGYAVSMETQRKLLAALGLGEERREEVFPR